MKRRIVVSLMAMMMLVSLMAPAAFAVSPEDTEGQEKQLYSVTVDLADLMATGGSKYKSVDLSLILPARSSGGLLMWLQISQRFRIMPLWRM